MAFRNQQQGKVNMSQLMLMNSEKVVEIFRSVETDKLNKMIEGLKYNANVYEKALEAALDEFGEKVGYSSKEGALEAIYAYANGSFIAQFRDVIHASNRHASEKKDDQQIEQEVNETKEKLKPAIEAAQAYVKREAELPKLKKVIAIANAELQCRQEEASEEKPAGIRKLGS